MTFLRGLAARLFFVLALLVLGLWATARFVIHTVDDGTVVTGVATTALHQPEIQKVVTDQAQSLVDSQLASQGLDPAALGLQDQLHAAIASIVRSDAFIASMVGLIQSAEADLVAQLTDGTRPAGPLTLTIDISGPLYAQIDAVPGLSGLVPQTNLAPIQVDALDANSVWNVRHGYNWVERISTWGLWIGLALVLIGVLLTPKKRWLLPRLFLWAGVLLTGAWALARWVEVDRLLAHAPGGADGTAASVLGDFMPQSSVDRVQGTLLKLAIATLLISVLLYVTVWSVTHNAKARDRERDEELQADDEARRNAVPVGASAMTGSAAMTGSGEGLDSAPRGAEAVSAPGAASTGDYAPPVAGTGADPFDVMASDGGGESPPPPLDPLTGEYPPPPPEPPAPPTG